METVLLVVQLMIAIAMIIVILFQRTAQDGGGLVGGGGGGGTMGGLFTARGSANLLTRTTAVLATLFIVNSLTLAYIASNQHQASSVVDQLTPKTQETKTPAPAVPTEQSPAPTANTPAPAAVPPSAPAQSAPATQPAAPPQVPLQ